ncbi:MAG: flagellar basal-body rod protein FlgF [Nitrospirae bacterium]|nr:flagellar basal-body rod protein FlgF [Candidatus Troglogloeales bacterium]
MNATLVFPAAAAQMVMELRMQAISNNIANVGTTGFRRDVPVFASQIASGSKANSLGGAEDPTGGKAVLPIPWFPVLDEMVIDFSQGPVQMTNNPLDIAIDGKGFFQVDTPNGVRYTRNGAFKLSSEGQIVTQSGHHVLGEGGAITLPPGLVTIDEEGRISVKGNDGGAPVQVDLLALVNIETPSLMKREGDNLFELVGENATLFPQGRVRQGALEGANVDPITEMVAMISAMRQYESLQKAIQGADDMALKDVNQIGQLRA